MGVAAASAVSQTQRVSGTSILATEQTDRLEKSIRKVVREELQAVNITNAVPSPPPANTIPDSALDFLNSL